jgi:hypothetical protein
LFFLALRFYFIGIVDSMYFKFTSNNGNKKTTISTYKWTNHSYCIIACAKRFYKLRPLFSIQEIGTKRFYVGILIGLFSTFVCNEFFRSITKLAQVEWNPILGAVPKLLPYHSNSYYSILIGLTSAIFGFCFTVYMWLSKACVSKRLNRKHRHGQSLLLFVVFLVFMFFSRMMHIINCLDLVLQEGFNSAAFLLPVFLFLYSWNVVVSIYKLGSHFFLILFMFISLGWIILL